jgi:hypothetical protein
MGSWPAAAAGSAIGDPGACQEHRGTEPGFATPAQTMAFLEADSGQWGKRIKAAGIEPQ